MKRTLNDGKHIELLQAIAGVDKRVAVVENEVKELSRRVGVQNGRVADSEAAIKKIVNKGEFDDGVKEGTAETKKLFSAKRAAIIGALTFILGAIIVPILSAYIQKK